MGDKMSHIASKLGQAGYANAAVVAPTKSTSGQTALHTEKITHITSKLSKAGFDSNTGSNPQKHTSNMKMIIIIVIVGVLGLITLAAATFFIVRRFRQRKAYATLNNKQKNVEEKDVFNAELDEAESLQGRTAAAFQERNFENGYDNVDTQYEGRGYNPEASHGDKRAKYEA